MAVQDTIFCTKCRENKMIICSPGDFRTICDKCQQQERQESYAAEQKKFVDQILALDAPEAQIKRLVEIVFDLEHRLKHRKHQDPMRMPW